MTGYSTPRQYKDLHAGKESCVVSKRTEESQRTLLPKFAMLPRERLIISLKALPAGLRLAEGKLNRERTSAKCQAVVEQLA
jgi:hypothetical protein